LALSSAAPASKCASSTFETLLMTRRDLTITLLGVLVDTNTYSLHTRLPLDSRVKPKISHSWRELRESVDAFGGHNMSNGHNFHQLFEILLDYGLEFPYLTICDIRFCLLDDTTLVLPSALRNPKRFKVPIFSKRAGLSRLNEGLLVLVRTVHWALPFDPPNPTQPRVHSLCDMSQCCVYEDFDEQR
jgi:hypothetical protein